ncbi:hypothetical protein G6L63_11210 [Agrobacterium vitis]|uniref:hypothetical protein n=1 Tax=Agrobacterium vitis TaxID=373 RepID=UPI00157312F4|nr:hypothetical protein [Agrobacterium vitis]NSZ48478.1 hypothetical protein [Agrobacterium vitis]UJL73073.1 hypothetical protein AVCG412_09740 [Agrobacterium vitis]
MTEIIVQAEVRIPLEKIVDAIGPEITRALISGKKPSLRTRPLPETVRRSVERVVSALDHLEIVTHTVGEPSARAALMAAIKGLRAAHIKNRKQ